MNIQKLAGYWFTLFIVLILSMGEVYADVIISEEGECYAKNLPQAGLPMVFPNLLKFTWKTEVHGDKTKIQWNINDKQIENQVISDKNDKQLNNPLYDSKGQFIGISGQELKLGENNYILYRVGINRKLQKDNPQEANQQENNFFKFTFGVFEKKDGKLVKGAGSGFYNSQDSSCQIHTIYNIQPEVVQDYPSSTIAHCQVSCKNFL
ncbi:MAG TPA: hypothetical protein VKR58_14510, partial [Aquella sp.]|nr:hypothetical protein [Aquella sp.]